MFKLGRRAQGRRGVIYHRTFCPACRTVTNHTQEQEFMPLVCVHKHEAQNDVKRWDATLISFRTWLADLKFAELLEVSKEVEARLCAELARIEVQKDRRAS